MSRAMFALGAVMLFFGASAHPVTFNFVQSMNQNPISKVVNLMKDMLKQLEVEQADDQKTYDAMVCWCETGNTQKKKAIADAEQHTSNLAASIEELTAKSAQLKIDIQSLTENIAKSEKALDEAAEVRAKELAEFNQEEKDAIQGIGGLKGALQVLSKHNAASLSQQSLLQVHSELKRHLSHGQMTKLGLTVSSSQEISFLQQSSKNSGEIFGVMQAMKENFEANLAKSSKEEEQGASEYEGMRSAKETEVAAASKAKSSKVTELAQAGEDLENSKIDKEDTEEQLEADRESFATLKKTCVEVDDQWDARTKARQAEVEAVNAAVKILTDDEAKDLAAKTSGGASFIQTSLTNNRRSRSAAVLRAAAKKFGNPRLSLLAMTLKSDVFAKIKVSINQMVAQLKVEQKDEGKKRDWCREQLHQLDSDEAAKYDAQGKQQANKKDFASKMIRLTDEIKAAEGEVTSTMLEMKEASENRVKESKEFTMVIADQRAMHALLSKALNKLKAVYAKKALVQEDEKDEQMPMQPTGFAPYKPAGGGGGVLGLIKGIMKECSEAQTHAIFSNHESQMAYEEFMVESNKNIMASNKSISDKSGERAGTHADNLRNDEDLQQTMKDLQALADYSKELHGQCDFIMNNFAQRQDARTQEMDALQEAKMIMN